eukprot:jgi/Tetstr1/442949/TSEL_031011.t1
MSQIFDLTTSFDTTLDLPVAHSRHLSPTTAMVMGSNLTLAVHHVAVTFTTSPTATTSRNTTSKTPAMATRSYPATHPAPAEMRVGEEEMRHRHVKMWPCDSHQRHPKAPDGLTLMGDKLLLLPPEAEMRVGEAEMRHRHGKIWPCDSHQRHPKAPDGLTWLRVSA